MRPSSYNSGDDDPRSATGATMLAHTNAKTSGAGQEKKTGSTLQAFDRAVLPRFELLGVPGHGCHDTLGVSPVAIAEHPHAVFDFLSQTPYSHIVLDCCCVSTRLRRGVAASGGKSRSSSSSSSSRGRDRVMSVSGGGRKSHREKWLVTGGCWLGRANVSVSVQTAPGRFVEASLVRQNGKRPQW